MTRTHASVHPSGAVNCYHEKATAHRIIKTLREAVLLGSSANSQKIARHRKALSERFSEASRIIGPETPPHSNV